MPEGGQVLCPWFGPVLYSRRLPVARRSVGSQISLDLKYFLCEAPTGCAGKLSMRKVKIE